MQHSKFLSFTLMVLLISTALALLASAAIYNLGVSLGQYVTYGNFVGSGPGTEPFNDYAWSKVQVIGVSGKQVTLLSTGQFKNGTATPGNGTTNVWDVEAGTEDGSPSTQGPIIAANLNAGDAIPPPNTYSVNRTEDRVYLGIVRSVNILSVELFTPDYNTTLTFVYDKLSGLLLESNTQTTVQGQPEPIVSQFSYSIVETNIFSSTTATPSPTSPATPSQSAATSLSPTQTPLSSPQPPAEGFPISYILVPVAVIVIVVAVVALVALARRKKTQTN